MMAEAIPPARSPGGGKGRDLSLTALGPSSTVTSRNVYDAVRAYPAPVIQDFKARHPAAGSSGPALAPVVVLVCRGTEARPPRVNALASKQVLLHRGGCLRCAAPRSARSPSAPLLVPSRHPPHKI